MPVTVEESDIDEFLKKLQDQKAVYEVADNEVSKQTTSFPFEYADSEIIGAEQDTSSSKELIKEMERDIPA
jgi:hypothetical protein